MARRKNKHKASDSVVNLRKRVATEINRQNRLLDSGKLTARQRRATRAYVRELKSSLVKTYSRAPRNPDFKGYEFGHTAEEREKAVRFLSRNLSGTNVRNRHELAVEAQNRAFQRQLSLALTRGTKKGDIRGLQRERGREYRGMSRVEAQAFMQANRRLWVGYDVKDRMQKILEGTNSETLAEAYQKTVERLRHATNPVTGEEEDLWAELRKRNRYYNDDLSMTDEGYKTIMQSDDSIQEEKSPDILMRMVLDW